MLPILLSISMILIFCIIGLLCFKLFKLDNNLLTSAGFCVFIPVLGAVSLTCIIQIFSLAFPVKLIAPGLLLVLICALFFLKDIGLLWLKTMLINKYLLIIILIALFILQLPILFKNELLSLQNGNPDIAYYLSSMDWLKFHRITEPVIFSSELPFYSLANFMINNTRFGTDLLGSFFMCIFQLQPHQIYYLFSTTLTILTIFAAFFLLSYCLSVSKKTSLYASTILASGGLWVFLIFSQYAPQIYGIACLISFTGIYIVLNRQNQQKGFIILSALLLVGTITVYAEYAVYLFCIFMIITICGIFNARSGTKLKVVLNSLKVGILSFILNPVGMFVAARFNVNILTTVIDNTSNIDPYAGKLMHLKQMMGNLYGAPDLDRLRLDLDTLGIPSQIIMFAYNFLTIALPLLFVVVVIIGMLLKREWHKYVIIGIIGFFIVNELYLRSSSNAYAEMKHITTIAPFLIICFAYFTDGWSLNFKKTYIKKAIMCCTVLIIISSNIMTVYQNYNGAYIYYIDNSVMELRSAANLVPPNEPIGITDSSPADKHSIVYALKDIPIKHNKTFAFDNSYFRFLVPHEFENTRYSIVSLQDYLSFLSNSEDVLWHNNKFVLLHVPTVAIRPIDGFYNIEKDSIGYFRWTSLKKSELSLFNSTDDEQILSISINTNKGPFEAQNIKIFANEKLIGQGVSDTIITTQEIHIMPHESLSIFISSDGDLNTVDTGDNRTFGFMLRHIDIKVQQ